MKQEITILINEKTIGRLDIYQRYMRPDKSLSIIIEDLINKALDNENKAFELECRLKKLEEML